MFISVSDKIDKAKECSDIRWAFNTDKSVRNIKQSETYIQLTTEF